jgi:hypothetical protein
MNSNTAPATQQTIPKMTFEAARMLLDEALEAEKKDKAADAAQKRAINAYTGASALPLPEIIVSVAPANSDHEQGN